MIAAISRLYRYRRSLGMRPCKAMTYALQSIKRGSGWTLLPRR